jgi:predicted nucleic acid-binding protein
VAGVAITRCLDSDFLIDILAGKKEAEHKMLEIEDEKLATTAINVFEILFGAEYSHNEKNVKESHRILSGIISLLLIWRLLKKQARFKPSICEKEIAFQFVISSSLQWQRFTNVLL